MSSVNPEDFQALGVEFAVMRTKNEARDSRLDDHDSRLDGARKERREMQKSMGDIGTTTGEIRDHLKKAGEFRSLWEAWLTPTRVLTFLVLLMGVGTAVRQIMAGEEVDLPQIRALEDVVIPVTVPSPQE